MDRVFINEQEFHFLELFRIALSEETHEDRLAAIRYVKHEVAEARLQGFVEREGPDWTKAPANRELVEWVAMTSSERAEAVYEFARVSRRYEDRNERRLNIAEQAGMLIYLSIHDGKFEGVHTWSGILYQVTEAGKAQKVSGARDKDTVRKTWSMYRGVVHLGMAMDICEGLSARPEQVLHLAEQIRRLLSETCPKGTSVPYVLPEEQISFVYEPMTYGPRF